ncbi:unnamed protein product [Pseudo-nitzschia multistriata]|uniref:RNA helicase n=1 Tax=Pseudo-nitzschia multistriata TaxID=183589 RepID=A0A448Z458_9STRA|nr:unnamed protein product [Pseudo-nitzschia multistriata]
MVAKVEVRWSRKRLKALLFCSSCHAILLLGSRTNSGWVSGFSSNSFSSTTPRVNRLLATTADVGKVPASLLDDLESCTVKELKQILKENKLDQERGTLTKLKRKKDLVDYLRMNLVAVEEEHKESYDGENDDGDDDSDSSSAAPPVGIELSEGDFSIVDDDETGAAASPPPQSKPKTPRAASSDLMPDVSSKIPAVVREKMASRGIHSLLPIQQASFEKIFEGEDAVLHSPTGSGKTLAFVLPLLSAAKRRPWQRKKVASPRIITICPSRELAKQVGKEYSKLAGKAFGVATVFGGVPIERHVSLLKYKPQIVVTTPGRLRELVREGHMDYSQVSTLVLDEADLLLDPQDSPDVFSAIEDIEKALEESDDEDPEYQMVLVSATIGKNVKDFAAEMEFPESSFVNIEGIQDSKKLVDPSSGGAADSAEHQISAASSSNAATVGHWHMSCKSAMRPEITANLISVLSPRLTIVFVPTKSATESVAAFLSEKAAGTTIRILHGDMSQSARSRCIGMIREDAIRKEQQQSPQSEAGQILVATDVASRGLDLPNVDLVVQFGLPRIAGKDGTINPELYAHRTGRTGRFRGGSNDRNWGPAANRYETANAVALYDPAVGEGKLVTELVEAIEDDLGVTIQSMSIPSSAKVVDAAYQRLSLDVLNNDSDQDTPSLSSSNNKSRSTDLAAYFKQQLKSDKRVDSSDPEELLGHLANAMVRLSKLDPSLSPYTQSSSLLTGDPTMTTLRLYPRSIGGSSLTPPVVTSFCKQRGSGKLGRVVISKKDGSAIFDLPEKRANKLMEIIKAEEEERKDDDGLEYGLEIPISLPEL